ncbi:MAG: hypothetical protein LBQ38_09515 [Spirochaetaceae bacterium]|jgi:hypothetical protein|nr:hypothetical protein [Spirochaetaceae bacterium]
MYVHPKLVAFTQTLDALFREVDEHLEDRWGHCFSLHPNRPKRGLTGNPETDGLFEIAPDFTPGFGSQRGRGYVVSLRVATLEKVPPDQFRNYMEEAAAEIRNRLPRFFPGRSLAVVRDGKIFKIIGDFSLGEV